MYLGIEVVCVPVSDVDAAISFYTGVLGFRLDHDTAVGAGVRAAQLTPPGSGCSIVVGTGITRMAPGSLDGLQLVVGDIRATRAELAGRGLDVTEVRVYSPDGLRPAEDGDELDNNGFCYFRDPDGNGWALQQITARG